LKGENVEKFRKKAGFSQEELAVKSQLDLTSVSEIESGLRNPSLKTIYKLAKALKVNSEQLLPF